MSDLFTVLIAEKEHIEAIQQQNRLFFEPFLSNKELALCIWNPAGQTLSESVPGLLDAVGRRKSWRAVIINPCSPDTITARNPFDVVEHSALSALTEPSRQPQEGQDPAHLESEWAAYYRERTAEIRSVYQRALEHPLQRLATWLCFRPEDYILQEVQQTQDVHDWAMEQLGSDTLKLSSKLELMERDQYKLELRLRETLRRDFVSGAVLNIAHPAQLYCISPRTAKNGFFDPASFWTVRSENEYSAFADRNLYFDSMRFMVFDLLPQSHRNYRTDYIRLLASTLIFASNPVPSSAMQARRLYQLETEADDAPLCTLVTSYDRKLAATFDVIDTEMERIRSEIPSELTDKAAEELFCASRSVDIVLDSSCNPDRLQAETDYGLFFDSPENETQKFSRDYQASVKELSYITKQQLRSVRKGVAQMHLASEVSHADISRLTALQLDDIRDYTHAAENEMIDSIPSDLTDMAGYEERIRHASEQVQKVTRRRMEKKTVIILSALCLGLYALCFLPFLMTNHMSARMFSTTLTLVLAVLGSFAALLFVTLLFLRTSVTGAVRHYNDTTRDIFRDIQAAMQRFSRYLTASCNARRGHAVLISAQKDVDEYTKSLHIRKRHQEDIRRKRAGLKENYSDYLSDGTFCDETLSRPYEYDFDQKTEYPYPAPFLAGDARQVEFVSSGNFVLVPSSYVSRILVRAEGIYED
ncbi:MAG: hypothetical protein IJP02_05095 [Oscillospiraceae bacterium]|nr:hypothetical protein [Oscillospiraceae bacterium]